MSVAGRVGRIAGAVVLVAVAAVALAVGGAVAVLRTAWGADLARRLALPRLNAVIAGNLAVARFRFGGDRLALEGVALRDPDGAVAARVARVAVRFSPLALLRRRVEIDAVDIEAPELALRADARGLNLARALAPRARKQAPPVAEPAKERGGGGGLTVDLRRLDVRGGVVDFRDARPARERGPAPHVRVEGIWARGDARLGPAAGEVRGTLALIAAVAAPVTEPLLVVAHGARAGERGDVRVDLRIGPSGADLAVRLRGAEPVVSVTGAEPIVSVTIDRLDATPALARAFAPGYPLLAPVTAHGSGRWNGARREATADLEVGAGGAAIAVRGSLDVAGRRVPGLAVRGRGIDLHRLLAGAPPSALAFDLEAHGALDGRGGFDPAALRGQLTFEAPVGQLGGRRFGPVRLRADAERGRYRVVDLLAAFPGVRLTGAAVATASRIEARAVAELGDLGETARSLLGRRAAAAGGRGRVEVALAGPLAAPSLRLDGRLAQLAWQDLRVSALTLAVRVPDVRQPQAVDVTLRAPEVKSGARRLRGVALDVRAAGRRLDVTASLQAPAPVRLEARGVWGRRHELIDLDAVTFAYPEARWSLARRARIVFGGPELRIEGLDLRSGAQALRLDLRRAGAHLRADAAVTALDLAKLPSALLPPRFRTAGHVDADVHLRGTRASGRVDVAALGAKVAGRFDLPLAWPPPAGSPLALALEVSGLDLARVQALVAPPAPALATAAAPATAATAATAPGIPPVRGTASLSVNLDGTGAAPSLVLDARVAGLAADGASVGDLALHLDARHGAPLGARLDVASAAAGDGGQLGSGSIRLTAPVALAEIVRRPPAPAAWAKIPIHVDGALSDIPLGPWAKLAHYPARVAGTASLTLALDGPPLAPQGRLALALHGVASDRLPPTDGAVELGADARAVRASVRVTRRERVLLDARAELGVPPARLRDPAVLASAPLTLHAALGPVELQRLGLPPKSDRDPPRVLRGVARAEIDVAGTLRAPRATITANARDLKLDEALVGTAAVRVAYRDRRLQTDVALTSPGGGTLHLTAAAGGDLGYPAIARLDVRAVPLTARLDARGFDLRGLSGVTQHLRTVAGKLSAAATMTGNLGDPVVAGEVELQGGALAVTGLGEYHAIHLKLRGDRQSVVLDELAAESGSGRARVTGRGVHRPGQGYGLSAKASLKQFPIYVEGQALAGLSLDAAADADISTRRVKAKVKIDEAHVALTDAKRKHLQPLASPPDVVLMEGGKPLNAAQEKKLAALLAERRAEEGQEEGAARAAAARAGKDEGAPSVRVTVEAPRNLWVKGKDANIELGLEPGFRVVMADEPRIFGTVTVRRGRVNVVGRRFDIKQGSTIRFNGASDRPELDVTAQHVNDRENVTVLVDIKGTPPDKLSFAVRAPDRPDLSETQLYTLVVTGRVDLGGGRTTGSATPTEQAASLLGGLLASQLQKTLSGRLPFDVLTIETDQGLSGTRLEAGTYLTDDLYVGYVGHLGADPSRLQNRNAVHLEYQLSRRWSVQGEYGDAKTGSGDLLWRKHY